jgi:Tfp pilus assembly protein PilF
MKIKLFAIAVGVLAIVGTGCDRLKSRDRLNRGVQAYKSAKYSDAVDFFKEAVALDPANLNGRLYLATAYMSQYIPGATSPENLQVAKQAKDEFLKVLEKDPNDKTALASLASLSWTNPKSGTSS